MFSPIHKIEDLIESCEKWEDQPANLQTYPAFQTFMIKQVIRVENRKGILGTAKIANFVEATTKQLTKSLSGELLIQADTIARLTAQLDEQDNQLQQYAGGPPSMVNTGTSSVMSQQNQAMQVEINSLKAAVMVAVAVAAVTSPPAQNRTCPTNKKKSDNDMDPTSTQPFIKRSICRYNHDNYCHSCGYDISKIHDSSNC